MTLVWFPALFTSFILSHSIKYCITSSVLQELSKISSLFRTSFQMFHELVILLIIPISNMNYCPCTHNLWPYTPFSFRKTSDKIELVVTGPYRLVRHPVYTSLILGIWIIPTLVSIFLEIIIVPITNLQVEILTFEITAWVYGAVKVLYTWTLTQQRRPYYRSTIPMHQAPGNEATQYLLSICTSFIMCSLIHLFVCGIITFWKYL